MSGQLLFSPLSWAIALAVLWCICGRKISRLAQIALMTLLLFSLVLMTPAGANLLVRAVESRVPAVSCPRPPSTVVVLSGGLERPARSVEDFSAANAESLHRLFAGVALWRTMPSATLIVTGGDDDGISQGALLARLAERMGVPASSIRVEGDAKTTWENARNVAAMSPKAPPRIWLVSSALHLPRALAAFRAFGFQPCPWSSGSLYLPPHGVGYFVPQSSALEKTEFVLHEIVGGWIYAWRARGQDTMDLRAVRSSEPEHRHAQ